MAVDDHLLLICSPARGGGGGLRGIKASGSDYHQYQHHHHLYYICVSPKWYIFSSFGWVSSEYLVGVLLVWCRDRCRPLLVHTAPNTRPPIVNTITITFIIIAPSQRAWEAVGKDVSVLMVNRVQFDNSTTPSETFHKHIVNIVNIQSMILNTWTLLKSNSVQIALLRPIQIISKA